MGINAIQRTLFKTIARNLANGKRVGRELLNLTKVNLVFLSFSRSKITWSAPKPFIKFKESTFHPPKSVPMTNSASKTLARATRVDL